MWILVDPGINRAVQPPRGLLKSPWEGEAHRGTPQWQVPSPPRSITLRHGLRHPHTLPFPAGADTVIKQQKSEQVWSCPWWPWGAALRRAEQGLPEHGHLTWYLQCSPLVLMATFLIWFWGLWADKRWGWKSVREKKKLLTFWQKIAYSVLFSRGVALRGFIRRLPIPKITWLKKDLFRAKGWFFSSLSHCKKFPAGYTGAAQHFISPQRKGVWPDPTLPTTPSPGTATPCAPPNCCFFLNLAPFNMPLAAPSGAWFFTWSWPRIPPLLLSSPPIITQSRFHPHTGFTSESPVMSPAGHRCQHRRILQQTWHFTLPHEPSPPCLLWTYSSIPKRDFSEKMSILTTLLIWPLRDSFFCVAEQESYF